jgi:hypothetical protein
MCVKRFIALTAIIPIKNSTKLHDNNQHDNNQTATYFGQPLKIWQPG